MFPVLRLCTPRICGFPGKRVWSDPEALRKQIRADRSSVSHEPPAAFRRKYKVTARHVEGWPCYTLAPRGRLNERHVLYLHGGGYVFNITKYHWLFLGRLVNKLRCQVTVPIYPLAPEHCYREVFPVLTKIYRQILSTADASSVAVMGDSAGGGMSLALGQLLKKKGGLPQPKDIVLISPWLDITMSDPMIDEIEPRDPVLARAGPVEAGRMYAGGDDPTGHLLSPIYGDLAGLPVVSLFIGTRDVLLADARRLRSKAQEEKATLNYFEYPGMFHCWVLVRFPEAVRATDQIAKIIQTPVRDTGGR